MWVRGFVSLLAVVGLGISAVSVGRSSFERPASSALAGSKNSLVDLSIWRNRPLDLGDDAQVRELARQAYVWGWPLVYVHNCRRALENVPVPARSGGMPIAPINQLCMLTDYISPKQTVVPCPNQDVVYGFGMFDLEREPVVLQVPDFGDRFWVYQLGDQRTDGFAKLGSIYNSKPGLYLVVDSAWQGSLPEGFVEVLRSPTRYAYCLPRVFLADTSEDRAAVQPTLNQILAYPLSRFTGEARTTDWQRVRWLPQLAAHGGRQSRWVRPETFFDGLHSLLADVPPLAGEAPFYSACKRCWRRRKKINDSPTC
ncbi:MAG: DUF1254 domain-containing protein [Pirellulales bacterium]